MKEPRGDASLLGAHLHFRFVQLEPDGLRGLFRPRCKCQIFLSYDRLAGLARIARMSCAPCGRKGLRIQQIVPPLHVAEAVGLPGGVMLPPKVVYTSGASAPSTTRVFRVAGRPCFQGRRRRHEGRPTCFRRYGLRSTAFDHRDRLRFSLALSARESSAVVHDAQVRFADCRSLIVA
jgi:hypothetical protein